MILFVCALAYYVNAALTFPDLFNIDSQYNHAATSYIGAHKEIPIVTAQTEGILFTELGTTRSLRPPLTFIVSAIVSEAAKSMGVLLEKEHHRQRLGSSLLGSLTVLLAFLGFYISFKHTGLALLGALSLALLPKFLFLSSSNNDDIGAIFSVSALFVAVLALKEYGAKTFVMFGLAIATGLILQSKFTAWVVLPILCLYCLSQLKSDFKRVFKLSPILLLVMVLAGGWWPVFNMINYGLSDPTALNHAAGLQATFSAVEPNKQGYRSIGIGVSQLLLNYDDFLLNSFKSFIGYLQWLALEVGWSTYLFYGLLFCIGVTASIVRGVVKTRNGEYRAISLETVCLGLLVIQFGFYLHHNLIRDIQPQSRYVLPAILPLLYLSLSSLAAVPKPAIVMTFMRKNVYFQSLATTILLIFCVLIHVYVIVSHITPSYTQSAFYTRLSEPKTLSVDEFVKGSSVSALAYSVSGSSLELRRVDSGLALIHLDKGFCETLPAMALITMDTDSLTRGGFYIRLEKDGSQRFEQLNWSPVKSGAGQAAFVVSTQNCTSAQLTLGKDLHKLIIRNIKIRQLRVNKYGKPV